MKELLDRINKLPNDWHEKEALLSLVSKIQFDTTSCEYLGEFIYSGSRLCFKVDKGFKIAGIIEGALRQIKSLPNKSN